MFVHSIYYLTPSQVVAVLRKTTMRMGYAVVHMCQDPLGSLFKGECTYWRTADGRVKQYSAGNLHLYTHPNVDWLRKGYYQEDADTALIWYILRQTPDSVVYAMRLGSPMQNVDEPAEVPFETSLVSSDHYGVATIRPSGVEKSDLTSRFMEYVIPDAKVLSYGEWFATYSLGEKPVPIPKAVVLELQTVAVGRVHDENLYQELISRAKSLAPKYNVPASHMASAIHYCVLFAMTKGLERKTATMNAIMGPAQASMTRYNQMLKFKFVSHYGCLWRFTALSVAATFIAALLYVRRSRNPSLINTMILGSYITTLGALLPIALRRWVEARARSAENSVARGVANACYEAQQVLRRYVVDRASAVLWGPAKRYLGGFRLPSTQSEAAGKELADGASLQLPMVHKFKDTTRLLQVAPVFPARLPIYYSASTHNETTALSQRHIAKTPEPDITKFEQLRQELSANLTIVPIKHIEPVPFDIWNARFPRKRQEDHLKALKTLEMSPHRDWKTIARRKAFPKQEKLFLSTHLGLSTKAPRMIQGATDEANVILGPWVLGYANFLKEKWNVEAPITYAAGLSSEQVGRWFDICKEQHYVFFKDDVKAWDASYSVPCIRAELSIYQMCGAMESHDRRKILEAQLDTWGVTTTGIRYGCAGTRKSGDPNTSCGNSLLNGLLHWSIIYRVHGGKDPPFKMMVMGDDNVFGVQQDIAEGLAEKVNKGMLEYGFNSTCAQCDAFHQVEFCSGLFWPSEDGTVFGPKPGRIFARIGWTLTDVSPKDRKTFVKGVALGFAADVAHIPPLRELIRMMLRLTDGAPSVPTQHERRFHVSRGHRENVDTWTMLQERYGYTRESHDQLIRYLDGITSLDETMTHPVISLLVEVDCP